MKKVLKSTWPVILIIIGVVVFWDKIKEIGTWLLVLGLIGGLVFYLFKIPRIKTFVKNNVIGNPVVAIIILSVALIIVLGTIFIPRMFSNSSDQVTPPAVESSTTDSAATSNSTSDATNTVASSASPDETSDTGSNAVPTDDSSPEPSPLNNLVKFVYETDSASAVLTPYSLKSDALAGMFRVKALEESTEGLAFVSGTFTLTSEHNIISVRIERSDIDSGDISSWTFKSDDSENFVSPKFFTWQDDGPCASEIYNADGTYFKFIVALENMDPVQCFVCIVAE